MILNSCSVFDMVLPLLLLFPLFAVFWELIGIWTAMLIIIGYSVCFNLGCNNAWKGDRLVPVDTLFCPGLVNICYLLGCEGIEFREELVTLAVNICYTLFCLTLCDDWFTLCWIALVWLHGVMYWVSSGCIDRLRCCTYIFWLFDKANLTGVRISLFGFPCVMYDGRGCPSPRV